jgi:anti-sigma factor RsiW
MMEKNTGYQSFQKKIVPYIDGSLAPEETAEFEAFVLTHPEFEAQIKNKQEEIELIRNMIPNAMITAEASESLENEIRSSIFNLLKEEPKSFLDSLRIKWEEWINR